MRLPPCFTQNKLLRAAALATISAAALLLGGCANYHDETEAIRNAWIVGDVQSAATLASEAARKKEGSVDYIVFALEEGATRRAAGDFKGSNEAFARAEAKMSSYAAGADVQLAAEAGASMTNLSYLPYTGTAYDKVMLSTYRTLNDLQLGDFDAARVNLNRALEYQRQAVQDNAREIEAAEKAAQNNQRQQGAGSGLLDVKKTQDSPALQRSLSPIYQSTASLQAYSDYVNPFTVLLDGLFFLYLGEDASDLERAHKSLERVRDMADEGGFIKEDLETFEKFIAGQSTGPTTYVIFETGMVAHRDQTRIDIPLFIFGVRDVPYIGAAFPRLVTMQNYAPHLIINANAKGYRTQRISRMDSVVARQFENDFPVTVTKTLISSGLKAAATYGLAEAGRQIGNDSTGQLIGNLILAFGTAYQAIMNEADLRSWSTLPKFFEYARFPTPPNRKLTLTAQNGISTVEVELLPAEVNVVYAKSISPRAPLIVSQFILKPLEGHTLQQPAPTAGAASQPHGTTAGADTNHTGTTEPFKP